jgi:regulatory protein
MSPFDRSVGTPTEESADGSPAERPTRNKKCPTPRRPSPERLERWALHHLQRHGSSSSNLKVVLLRRVRRHADELATDVERAEAEIDRLITRLAERGYLDDRAYAKGAANRLRGRGSSELAIRARLAAKGIPSSLVTEILRESESAEPELEAAIALARRRGLGPFRRDPEQRKDRRERDLAAFGRAGFSYDVARRVVEAEDPSALESLLGRSLEPG